MTRQSFVIMVVVLALSTAGGCIAPDPPSLTSDNPDQLIPAIKIAVQHHDQSAVPVLVKNLDSEDSAIRFYSIDGLQRLTGQDLGYRFYDDREHRQPAVDKWKQWLAEHK